MATSRRSAAGVSDLRVRVLGGFAVEGIEEREFGTRKARLLLKRLAVACGRPVAPDELAAAVWGQHLPANPGDQVSVLVSRLRRVLGTNRLPRSDAGYCLAADWFDLVELEQSVVEVEERLQAGETAAALVAGHVILGLAAGSLLPEDDGAWVSEERPAADRLVNRGRLAASEAVLAAGEFAAARAAAQSVLDEDPYDETALRLVMRADAFAGRPGSALAAYAAVRHRLSEDLGTDPGPETEAVHTAIVRGELVALPGTQPGAPRVVGRNSEFQALDAALGRCAGGEPVAMVIEAEAGLGKTTLLSAWASGAASSAVVISARCDELGGDLPLQPLVDGLDAHLESLGRRAASEVLGVDAPLLEPLLGRLPAGTATTATTVGDAPASRTALFTALVAVLRRAAGNRPMVLAIDDLHQAAAGTAEFMVFAMRRIPRVMVLAARRPEPGPDLPAAQRMTLGPLSLDDVIAVVGSERGPGIHERSGGHPLFVRELAVAVDQELPLSLMAAVRSQVHRLGPAAVSVEVAASCGTEIDALLIAAIAQRPISIILDDLESATRTGLLRPRGASLVFSHELVRQSIETMTSPPRTHEIHRAAVEELARRSDVDPLALARHARLGGDSVVAASALAAAADRAWQRFEPATAENLLDQAVELADSAPSRLARGRLRLARLDLQAARRDALQAIDLGAGVDGFELAGWVAYYGRDYDTALRYADEGVERAGSADVRASCLALAGRIRHTRGELADAAVRFEDGIAIAPAGTRGMLQVWHGQLLAHCGEPEQAADLSRRGLLDPKIGHPFVAGHGNFTLAYALGLAGRWSAALDAVENLDAWIVRNDDKRFPPIAANMRGWLLRGAGMLDEARELHHEAVEVDPGPTFQEAHYAALLDLIECHLAAGRTDEAGRMLDQAGDIVRWAGSMSWRHRGRYRLLATRIASLNGGHSKGADDARAIAVAAAERGDRRYEQRALITAATIDARAGRSPDPEEVRLLVERFVPFCGPDGWRDIGELAQAIGSESLWRRVEVQAGAIVAEASQREGFNGDLVARAVRRQLDELRP